MNISKIFHSLFPKNPCTEYIMTIENEMNVHILSYGATLYKIFVPDDNRNLQNILLSFTNINDYFENTLLAGACLGPNAGRLEDGLLPIDDNVYVLTKNNGKHQIHGGFSNVAYMQWEEECFYSTTEKATLTLSCFLPDKLDGYPGNRKIYATYELFFDQRLTLTLSGSSDVKTYFNLSNHAYFNLSGDFMESALHSYLKINALKYLTINEEHISKGISSVDNSPFDFKELRKISDVLSSYPSNAQTRIGQGYNHAFLFSSTDMNNAKTPAFILWDKNSKRRLSVYTDAPCVVLYSGGFIDKSNHVNDVVSSASCAIAFEMQDLPNAPIFGDFPQKLTSFEHTFKRTITYVFDCVEIV